MALVQASAQRRQGRLDNRADPLMQILREFSDCRGHLDAPVPAPVRSAAGWDDPANSGLTALDLLPTF
jgi:hypothetical protein